MRGLYWPAFWPNNSDRRRQCPCARRPALAPAMSAGAGQRAMAGCHSGSGAHGAPQQEVHHPIGAGTPSRPFPLAQRPLAGKWCRKACHLHDGISHSMSPQQLTACAGAARRRCLPPTAAAGIPTGSSGPGTGFPAWPGCLPGPSPRAAPHQTDCHTATCNKDGTDLSHSQSSCGRQELCAAALHTAKSNNGAGLHAEKAVLPPANWVAS